MSVDRRVTPESPTSEPVAAGRDDTGPAEVEPAEVEPAEVELGAEPTGARRWLHPSVESAVLLGLLVLVVTVGFGPLRDNSFLTHLATGRLILDQGSVPTADPYTWSALGEPWTVQSWGASVVYAAAESWFGLFGVRLVVGACTVTLFLLLWKLTEPARGLVGRVVVMGLVVAMGVQTWVERPLLFASVFLALVLLAADDRLDPRWLVPVMWLWVNMHGSFPFAALVLVLLALGRFLDERARPTVELRALGWVLVGTLLGALGPVGPRLLTFPLQLYQRREAFERVTEWQPPAWERTSERLFAVMLVLTLVLALWRDRRWRLLLPTLVFGAAAVTSARNILPASIVLAPVLATALAGLGQVDGRRRPAVMRPVALALAVLVGLLVVSTAGGPDTAFAPYPEDAVTWMRTQGLLDVDDRVVSRDYVGNYLEFRYGPDEVRVFRDDRVDLFPIEVIRGYNTFLDPGRDYQQVLEDTGATAVLWDRRSAFGRWLEEAAAWTVVYRDPKWLVAVPTGSGQ